MIEKERCICILNRKDEPLKMYSLKKMLEVNNMGSYYNICLNRLMDEEYIDDEDIIFDFGNGDVAMTDDGIFLCSDILSGFIPKDWLVEEWKQLRKMNKNVKELNLCFEAFRKMKFTDLLKAIITKGTPPETDPNTKAFKEVLFYLRLEILSRFFLNKWRIKLVDFISKIKVKLFTRKILRQLQ